MEYEARGLKTNEGNRGKQDQPGIVGFTELPGSLPCLHTTPSQ